MAGNRRSSTVRRYSLIGAAAVSAAGFVYHLAAGTPEVMYPLYAAALPPESVAVVDLIWYQVAALVAGGAVAMVVAAFRPEWRRPLAWFVGGHYLVICAICLVFSFAWFGNPWGLIQWAIFGPVALVTIWAARATPARP